MKALIRFFLFQSVIIIFLTGPSFSQVNTTPLEAPPGFPEGPFVEESLFVAKAGELIVKISKSTKALLIKKFKKNHNRTPSTRQLQRALARSMGFRVAKQLNKKNFVVKGRRINTAKVSKAKRKRIITRSENNFKIFAFFQPNDLIYRLGLLWGHDNQGLFLGKEDVDIDAPEAWDITMGDEDLVVGVIDTGIAALHPDLEQNLWQNPLEEENGLDDDGNGYIDDFYGWDFINEDADPLDDFFHGSHCAGTIGAVANNSSGLPGIAPNVKLLSLKILDGMGEGDLAGLVRAIEYAIGLKRRGVNIRVLNASLGGGENSAALGDALRRANRNGILFVAAAGNDGKNNDQEPIYPAGYDLPNVISVAALDSSGKLASFSNFGADSVHVAAPGVMIWSTIIFNFYLPFSGTSMATPHVSGIAALIFSQYPDLTPEQVKRRIMNSVKPLPGLEGKMQAPGIVSALNALR